MAQIRKTKMMMMMMMMMKMRVRTRTQLTFHQKRKARTTTHRELKRLVDQKCLKRMIMMKSLLILMFCLVMRTRSLMMNVVIKFVLCFYFEDLGLGDEPGVGPQPCGSKISPQPFITVG